MNAVLFAPHADDESLFTAYTILRHQPAVVICFPSVRDYGDTAVRTAESRAAMKILGAGEVVQWDGQRPLEEAMRALDAKHRPSRVWAPHAQASHVDHVAVAAAAAKVFGDRVSSYHTYDAAGKVRTGATVACDPDWPERKRQALRCYRTQIEHPRAKVFFNEQHFDLDEYAPVSDAPAEPAGELEPLQTPEDGLVPAVPESESSVQTLRPPVLSRRDGKEPKESKRRNRAGTDGA